MIRYLFLFLLGLTSCAHNEHKAVNVEQGELGKVSYYYRSKTYFMPQPTPEALEAAKEQSVTTVINLRTDDETKKLKYRPSEEAKKRGLNYYEFPIDKDEVPSKEKLEAIEAAYMSHHKKGEKVIVHCSSGERAAGWFSYHLRTTHKENVDVAIKQAQAVGLKNEKLINNFKKAIE
jgi:uncharacterized protein (TIGR01244 family)